MATGVGDSGGFSEKYGSDPVTEDSSESDGEPEPSKSFHRRISTSKAIKNGVCIKEGFLMKQTSSFQRWKRRYFKLKPKKLYYAKDNKSAIFEEVDLTDISIAECSTKNANHSFQVITPFRRLILCAESRKEMEEWISALKTVSSKDFYEGTDHSDLLSGQHNWYVTSHARPTYCNICREALSGVTSHGLSCEVCKFKVHKKCAVKAPNNCKWTTLASVGKDIIEDEDGNIAMPHQWMEGNLPVSAKCVVCDKTCGSVLRLQDWRCLWCKAMVHTSCKAQYSEHCPLGVCRMSILPPTALHSISSDNSWEISHPIGCSPLLVFVNSKSGDNQGVKFLRRFKQLLNPAQVFDLMHVGPGVGIRLFKSFYPLRILVCGGDGSVSWVLAELDKLDMHKQCQVGVLPLGTGNDLARVLGWGSVCDDDTQLPQMVEKYEKATTKLLDRWCIMTYEGTMPAVRKSPTEMDRLSAFQNNVVTHLTRILHSDQYSVVISSAKVLCETVKDFIAKVGVAYAQDCPNQEDSITHKCAVLNEKLDSLLKALNEECQASSGAIAETATDLEEKDENEDIDAFEEKGENEEQEKDASKKPNKAHSRKRKTTFIQREALMSRANSLKKAVRQIIEHTEKAVDEQNAQTKERQAKVRIESSSSSEVVTSTSEEISSCGDHSANPDVPIFTTTFHEDDCSLSSHHSCWNPWGSPMGQSVGAPLKDTLQVTLSTIEGGASADSSPCPSPNPRTLPPSPVPSLCPSPSFSGRYSSNQNIPSPPSSPCRGDHSQHTDREEDQDTLSELGSPVQKRSETPQSPTASRRISSGAAFKHLGAVGFQIGASIGLKLGSDVAREKSRSPEVPSSAAKHKEFPIINPLASLPMWPNLNKDSLISKVLLANADALCAAASPLMDVEDITLVGMEEKCVMNNYFGIGLDAKITLEFHNKREEHPEKCRSRTKNLMWYGVLGGKELLHRTFRNLEQKVQLECDGRRIPLPSLQGIVVLNIPSYGGGSNFWGGTKEDDVFYAPAFDDKILEVVAVFGTVQMAASRVMNLQHHRIAQCRSVKITIMGDEGVPVQVDGEAWMQPPGYICIVHKNKTQVLCRNRQLEITLKTWQEKHRSLTPSKTIHIDSPLSEEETNIFASFVNATSSLVRCVKMLSMSSPLVEQELFPVASQTLGFIEYLFPGGRMIEGPNIRQHVTDLVVSSRHLYLETMTFLREKVEENQICPDLEEKLNSVLAVLEIELKKCSESQGLVHFHQEDEEAPKRPQSHYRNIFKLRFKKPVKSKSDNIQPMHRSTASACRTDGSESSMPETSQGFVSNWGTEEVARWLDSVHMGEYKENFTRHDIRGSELLNLERGDLKELGVTKVGHIKRIQQAISELSSCK